MNLAALRSGQFKLGIVARTEIQQRQIVDALNLLHIAEVQEFSNFFELSTAVDREEIQLAICTYADVEGASLLDQLSDLTARALSYPILIYAFLNTAEKVQIPALFNAGLFGWSELSNAPDAMAQSFFRFMKEAEHTPELHLIALNSLQSFLVAEKKWQESLTVAEAVLRLYPHSDQARVLQIEAYLGIGDRGRAEFLLKDMELYDGAVVKKVAHLREKILGENESHHKLIATQYRMDTALIVDPQEASLKFLESKLRELGFQKILGFNNGEDAAAAIKKHRIDFALIEWQSPGLGGPFILQRLREEGHFDVPVIVITEVLDRADVQLVKDMGVAYVLKRPVQAEQLTIAAAWAITQAKNPTEAASLERKILACLSQGDRDGARLMFHKFQTIPTRDPVKDKYLAACLLHAAGNFGEAKKLLIEATHLSKGDNVRVAAMLAKCLMRLGDVKAAISLLKKVSSLSPKNIERLCALAEVALQDMDVALAEESLIHAEAMDATSVLVEETKTKVAVVSGQTDAAFDMMKVLGNAHRIVAYLNNLAVGHVKSGETGEGLRLYKNCLRIIPSDQHELLAIVAYNLGLALIKSGDAALGSVYLRQASGRGESLVYSRANSLLKRIEEARQGGYAVSIVEEPMKAGSALGDSEIERIPLAENLERLRRQTYLLQGLLRPAKLPRRAS